MLGIRQKLSLGFGGLLLIMMLIGIQGILHLSQLGESIDVILRENYRSVIACQEMKESLERIDSGILFTLLGDEEKGKELIDKYLILFEKALQVESNNVTIPGEGEKTAILRELFKQFRAKLKDIEVRNTPLSSRHNVYFTYLLPIFQQIKNKADEILQLNQQNMIDANDHARKSAANARRQMYVLLFAGIITASGFVYFTGKWILHPITRLIKSTDEIGRGNLDLIVQSGSHDEIGYLSESFNTMTANLREFRRSDQARLVRIQQAIQQTFNSLPDAIAVIDFEGRVELATASARSIFGLRPDIRIQDMQFPLITDVFYNALKSGHITIPENGKTIIQQFVKGEERFFHPEAIPINDVKGQSTGVILLLKDVTQLRQQDELKKGIVSTVSHQLKTPLTSIRMAIHLLLEENENLGPLTDKQVELFLAAREDSDRLNDILSSLLDIGRMESGKVVMDFQATSPNAIVLDAADAYILSAHDRGIEIRTELAGDLPDVWADPVQISQVFSNLLGNALRYTNPGGTITVSALADNQQVFFKISDTGKGIPAEYIDRLFEQFFRVPEQKKETGAGLGLAIVKKIVEAHGGTIYAESYEGKGSTFTFTLKRTDQISQKELHA
jgi:two-component system, NtrC family, sensor histidine kinase KinB